MVHNRKIIISRNEQITLNAVCPSIDAANHKHGFETLSMMIAAHTGLDEKTVLDHLWHNEQKASSAIGNGIAIPHSQIEGLATPFTFFARFTSPVDFKAPDHKPVHMIFILLSPEKDERPYHLRRLAHISRLMSDPLFRQNLQNAADEQTIRHLWTAPETIPLAA